MPRVTADHLLAYASKLDGERLETAGGRAQFTVRVVPGGLEVTPASSGTPRVVARDRVQMVLAQYEQSRNLQPGQYQEITFDASYILALVAHYLQDLRGA